MDVAEQDRALFYFSLSLNGFLLVKRGLSFLLFVLSGISYREECTFDGDVPRVGSGFFAKKGWLVVMEERDGFVQI